MNIRLADLVDPPGKSQQVETYSLSSANVVSKKNSPFICHQLLAQAGERPTDFYHFYFSEHGRTGFAANVAGSVKYLWLNQGNLTLYVGDKVIDIQANQLVTFKASAPHRFENRDGELASGVFLVTYCFNN